MGFWDWLTGKKKAPARDMDVTWAEYRDNPRRKKRRSKAASRKAMPARGRGGRFVKSRGRKVRGNPMHMMHALPPRGRGGRFLKSRGRKVRGNPFAPCDSEQVLARLPKAFRKPSKYATAEVNIARGKRRGHFRVIGCGVGASSSRKYGNRKGGTFAVQYLSPEGKGIGEPRYLPKSWVIGTVNRIRRASLAGAEKFTAEAKKTERAKKAKARRSAKKSGQRVAAGVKRVRGNLCRKKDGEFTNCRITRKVTRGGKGLAKGLRSLDLGSVRSEIAGEQRMPTRAQRITYTPEQSSSISLLLKYRRKLVDAEATGNVRSARALKQNIAKIEKALEAQGVRANPRRRHAKRSRGHRKNPYYAMPRRNPYYSLRANPMYALPVRRRSR